MKRTEPSAYLAAGKDKPKLEYVPAAATDLAAKFKAMREQMEKEKVVQLQRRKR